MDTNTLLVIATIIGPILGSAVTLFVKKRHNRENMLLTLLRRLKDKKKISKKDKAKLEDRLNEILLYYRSGLKEPDIETIKYEPNKFIFLKNTADKETLCPLQADNISSFLFYFNFPDIIDMPISEMSESLYNKIISEKIDSGNKEISKEEFKLLIQNSKMINSSISYSFWINLPNLCIDTDKTLLDDIYKGLENKLREIFPDAKLYLEVFLSNDIIHYTTDKIANLSSNTENLIDNYYIKYRNDAYNIIGRNILLYDKQYTKNDRYNLPATVITKKLEKINFNYRNINEWDILNIWGYAGSGKTEIGNFIANKIKDNKDNKVLLIDIKSSELTTSIEKDLILDSTREKFIDSLLKILCNVNNNLLPEKFHDNDISIKAFRDSLELQMLKNQHKIVFYIDDYNARKNIHNKIELLLQRKEWGLKFIIVGRLQLTFEDEPVKYIESSLFNIEEATEILYFWKSGEKMEIANILQKQWINYEINYSIYLLRIIKNKLKDIEYIDVSKVLNKEIEKLLTPVFNSLSSRFNNDEVKAAMRLESIKKIVSIINNDDSRKIDLINKELMDSSTPLELKEFIKDLGLLSLIGRIHENDKMLSSQNVKKWSKIIKDEDSVKTLLKAGSDENIFEEYNRRGYFTGWKDTFVAEGCLAIRFVDDIKAAKEVSLNRKAVVKSFRLLSKNNSLSVLKLYLDNNVLFLLVKMLIEEDSDIFEILNKELLTDETINNLTNVSLKGIEELLLDKVYLNSSVDIYHIAEILFKISKKDSQLLDRMKDKLIINEFAELSLATIAYSITDNFEDFFWGMDKYIDDKKTLIKVALKIWGIEKTIYLVDSMKEVIKKNETSDKKQKLNELITLWRYRTENRDISELKQIIEILIHSTICSDVESEYNIILLKETCLKLKNSKKRSQLEDENKWIINKLKSGIILLIEKGKIHTINELIKWYVYFVDSELYREDINWEYNIKEKYAIPTIAYEKKSIYEIQTIIKNSHIDLCSIVEIYKLKNKIQGNNTEELVRDRFDYNKIKFADIDFQKPLSPTYFAVWKGEEITFPINEKSIQSINFIDKETLQNKSKKYQWRPKIIFI